MPACVHYDTAKLPVHILDTTSFSLFLPNATVCFVFLPALQSNLPPMSAIRSMAPQFSIAHATQIAGRLYGLTEFVRELPSERDQNLLFRRKDGREFILKIANRDERREVLDLQNRAMEHIGSTTGVVPTMSGDKIATADGHLVRLVKYIPGIPLAEFRPHTSELLTNLGRQLGRIDRKLAMFNHDAARRDLYWDVRNAEKIVT